MNRNGWGGLISGISSAMKTVSEEVKVYSAATLNELLLESDAVITF